jgi:hypothetical protein
VGLYDECEAAAVGRWWLVITGPNESLQHRTGTYGLTKALRMHIGWHVTYRGGTDVEWDAHGHGAGHPLGGTLGQQVTHHADQDPCNPAAKHSNMSWYEGLRTSDLGTTKNSHHQFCLDTWCEGVGANPVQVQLGVA